MTDPAHNNPVVVTGANGFLGRQLCAELLDGGTPVIALGRTICGEWSHPLLEKVAFDLTQRVPKNVCSKKFDVIVHCAAALPKSFENSASEAARNRAIDENVINFARRRGAGVVYASSSAVYEQGRFVSRSLPTPESESASKLSAYADEKLWAEQFGLQALTTDLAGFAAVRICAPYGPPLKHRTVISVFLKNGYLNKPITYHGTGSREQNFTYIDDVSSAFLAAMEFVRAGGAGVFNIAGSEATSMKQLAELAAEVTGGEAIPSGQDDPQEGFLARYSIEKAKRVLNWTPKTPLREGLKKCFEYLKTHPEIHD